MSFITDLKHGQQKERKLQEMLEKQFPGSSFEESPKLKEWDFKHTKPDGSVTAWEVKSDRMAPLTGNIAVEIESRGKTSGIKATTADMWCYFVCGEYWALPTDKLIQCLKEYSHKKVRGGDNNTSVLLLLKLEHFKNFATLIE